MPGRDFECPNMLKITASICKGCKPVMCANRINVNCMPCEPSARFSMLAECLDKELSEGITLVVSYMKKEIGRGCYVMPDSVIRRITDTFQEVVHTAEVELTCKGCTVGMCTVRLSMTMRCQNIDDDSDDDGGDDCCGDMFGDTSQSFPTSSDPCQGFYGIDEQSGDASPFCRTSSNNRLRCEAGGELKPRLIDVAGPYNIYSCAKSDDGCLKIDASPGPGGQFSFSARSHLGEGNTNRMCPPTSAPELKQMGMKRGHECPMCHEDVSWLPKIAACPHCGYKPLPQFEEKDYDETATAKDILDDFFQHIGSESKSLDLGSSSGCSKTCNNQASDVKTEEAFETIVHDYKSLKQSIKKCKSAQPCTSSSKRSQKKQQTNLVSIFTEMKKLFDDGCDEADKNAKIKEICEDACKLAKVTKNRRISNSNSKMSEPCGAPKVRKRRKMAHKLNVKSRVYAPMEPLTHPRQGHVHCHDDERKVPAHMGWLWTHNPLAQRPGWRPGAIRRSIRELMGYFLKDFPVDSIPISKYMSYHKHKKLAPHDREQKPEDLVQVPTLHIEKKNDEYLITLRPLKDPDTLKRAANPYANMKPVQFRIVKNPLLKQVREMKRCLKNMGFSKCKCHRPVMQCFCRSFIDKKQLVDEVQRQCHMRNMPHCENELVLSDTTDSEAEFDFGVTPPAGLMHPERLKTVDVTNTETQYNENDWAMPTMYPHPPNPNVQYGGCVVGERKGKFSWIFGKGYVHRTPKPPKMRNLPKKKPKKRLPGSPKPREKGGYNSDVQPKYFPESASNENQPYGDRLQRLNRAAHPPTAMQFQQLQSRVSLDSRKVRFANCKSERFTT
ncbi:uncharacterized protein Dvir_GJ10379 [Drosophila virilis]|uniref:DUF4776 domain-containing protein n=2 Tax=Drosophila virilis TaxID=7244 RepID=B4M6J2_DROVI|nr:uncharacterized protein Dvir_GJ10379 [Drosophila virilis]